MGEGEGGEDVGVVMSNGVFGVICGCFALFRPDLAGLGCEEGTEEGGGGDGEGEGEGEGVCALEDGEGALLLTEVAIPGGGPRIPAPAVCENLTYFCRLYFFQFFFFPCMPAAGRVRRVMERKAAREGKGRGKNKRGGEGAG